ncbi:MAG: hypothetical protein LH472_08775 [Pyrinomonadaceae bacterium]|nr:hypothetical protein [Pyrinomonadaceae bacterium]
MNEQNFNELLESVREVGLMEKGEIAPSREFVVEKNLSPNSSSVKTFAICLASDDEELIPLKIYHVVLHPQHQTCTVKDESDETLVCPIEWFLPVEFPKNVERLLEETELALA